MNHADLPLTIACAADAAYAMPLAVMLRSIDLQLAPELAVDVHVIDDGLSAGDRERVERSLSERMRLDWRAPSWPAGTVLPIWGQMPRTTYQRLTLGEQLPASTERVLWLDCDLLVTADLAALWRQELAGAWLLAARDRRVPTLGSRFGVAAHRGLGLDGAAPYFNAGVLLLDVAAWRAGQLGRRAIDYLERHGARVAFWDQEALNAVFAGHWRALDGRWNADPTLDAVLGPEPPLPPVPGLPGGPWILHFSGRLKPWTFGTLSPAHELYFRCLDRTAWAGWRPRLPPARRLLARYALSGLRRRLYGLETPALVLWRALTRRSQRLG